VSEFNKRLDLIDEQTTFLLEKQLEARDYCNNLFSEVLSLVDQKIQETDEESEDYKNIQRIHILISEQFSKFSDEVGDDIQFLEEQLKTIKLIKQMDDRQKAQELLNSLLEEGEQLLETDEFKKNLEEEADISKRNFITIIDDIKNALEDGNLQDLELILSSIANEEELYQFENNEEEDFEQCSEHSGESECSSCCSTCSESKKGCGIDIFSTILEEEAKKK